VTGLLQHADGSGGEATCKHCGAKAVGPCARCHSPVCGDCCVLTEGGQTVFAICLGCDKRGGRSLFSGWVLVLAWIGVPIAVLAAIVALIHVFTS
jgi:hypothetical protein